MKKNRIMFKDIWTILTGLMLIEGTFMHLLMVSFCFFFFFCLFFFFFFCFFFLFFFSILLPSPFCSLIFSFDLSFSLSLSLSLSLPLKRHVYFQPECPSSAFDSVQLKDLLGYQKTCPCNIYPYVEKNGVFRGIHIFLLAPKQRLVGTR